jgi:CRP-like cAMP-binding protein
VHAQAGDAVMVEGESGDGLYVLLSGRLRVSVGTAGTGSSVTKPRNEDRPTPGATS